jgi:shikimate kinase
VETEPASGQAVHPQDLRHTGVDIRNDIALIGPIGVGKSTVAALLAEALGAPLVSIDGLRSVYYAELGYDEAHAEALRESEGLLGLYRYWKPFEAHAVERVLAEHSGCVFDFGAGHSVFEDPRLFARVERALAGARFVVLLLPSPDPEASIRALLERLPPYTEGVAELNEHFVRHPSSARLATHTVYTEGKTPEEVRDEVLTLIGESGGGRRAR